MSDVRRKYCVFACDTTATRDAPHHRFPNPEKRPELFAAWVSAVGDHLDESDPKRIARNKRVCDHHFDPSTKISGGRLFWSAIPAINLHRVKQSMSTIVENDHSYSRPRREYAHRLADINNLPRPSSAFFSTDCSIPSGSSAMTCRTAAEKGSPRRKRTRFDAGLKQSIKATVESDHSYCSQRETRNFILRSCEGYNDAPDVKNCLLTSNQSHSGELHTKDQLFDAYSSAPRISIRNTRINPTYVKEIELTQDAGHSLKGSELEVTFESPADDSQHDHEEDILPKSEVPLPNSDMSLQKSDFDESAIFSWQIETVVKEEVLDGDCPDEAESSLYQDQDEAKVNNSALPNENRTKVHNSAVPDEDYAYRCNSCGENIIGFRYTCVQCADWDLCGACEARGLHAAHYVLRVPSPRPYKETQAVLEAIKRQLLHANVFIQEESVGLKMEVKEEPGLASEPPPEDDPLASGDIFQEEYVQAMKSKTDSIADHQSPRKRPRIHSQSDQNLTHDVTVTTTSDEDIARQTVDPNAGVWDRLYTIPVETELGDETKGREVTMSLIESQHSEMQERTFSSHQNVLNEDPRNNTHPTDSTNTRLHKRSEVIAVPESQLRSKTGMVLNIPRGVKVNAKDFVRQGLTDTATVRLTALNDRKRTTKLKETLE